MTFEVVIAGIPGVLTTRDARHVPEDALSFDVVVLGIAGAPYIGQVRFGDIPGGRGIHRGLTCATCGVAKYNLYCVGDGALQCAACSRTRSRRQNEKSCRAWKYFGGYEEDVLLRALAAGRARNVVPEDVLVAADSLMDGDRERWSELRKRADAALILATAGDVSAADVVEVDDEIGGDDDR